MFPNLNIPIHPGGHVENPAAVSLPHIDSRLAAHTKEEVPRDVIERDEFLRSAQDRFRQIISKVEQDWRQNSTDALDFVDGLQHWKGDQLEERKGLPCLVVDRIGPSVDQVVNDARQNPPESRVLPAGDGATKWTAEVIQGMLLNIDNDTNGTLADMTAYGHAVKIGRGWFRYTIEYESDDPNSKQAFDLKLVKKRVANPFSVYPDPAADEFDYSDMRYCFVTEDLDKDVFREMYPDAQANSADFEGIGDRIKEDWFPNGAVRVAEYWRVEETNMKIAQLSDRRVMPLADAEEALTPTPGGEIAPARIVNIRNVMARKVWVAKITAFDILEDVEWAGRWIPIVPVIGKELIYDKKRRIRGMIDQAAMDSNLMYDFAFSKQAEAVGLAPRSQWIVPKGQLESFESTWADANRKTFSYLQYNHWDEEHNQPFPPPQRISPSVDISSINQVLQSADNSGKATLSTYDASLGNAGPESSGRAIALRQHEGDNAHFNYRDNLAYAKRHGNRICIDLFPHVYNEEQVVQIYDPDGQIRKVAINMEHVDPNAGQIIHRIGKDYNPTRYDVVLGTGPSAPTRREAALQTITTMAQANPNVMVRGGDIVVKLLDGIPETLRNELAERLRPPDVANVEEGQSPMQMLAKMQQQQLQAQQMVQLLSQKLEQATQTITQKQIESASREKIAALQVGGQLLAAELKAGSDQAITLTRQEYQRIREGFDMMLQAHDRIQQAQQAQQAQQQTQQPAGQPLPSAESQPPAPQQPAA